MPSILAPNYVTRSHLGGGGEGAEHLPKLRDGFGVIGNQDTAPGWLQSVKFLVRMGGAPGGRTLNQRIKSPLLCH